MIRAFAVLVSGLASPLGADPLMDGRYAVSLHSHDGAEQVTIGHVSLSRGRYSVTMADAPFGDYFLSMRPFKCLEAQEKLWCHVPWPYAIARDISTDRIDLEYDFLFVWKASGDYGIDLWNGVYYRFGPDGVGRMHNIDLDALGVPPKAGDMRPIREVDLDPAEPADHVFPVLKLVKTP